jgi:hypothetical protein
MSNHYHLVVTDPGGRLPAFMHWLNEYLAKCLNAELGRWESFWAPGSYSAVVLTDELDVLRKLVYLFANPAKAGLVATLGQWPGAHSAPADMGGLAHEIERPSGFFREDGPVPRTVSLTCSVPPALSEDSGSVVNRVCQLLEEREIALRKERSRARAPLIGARRVLAQSPFSLPASRERRRQLRPQLACWDPWRRIEALQRLKGFLMAYFAALARFRRGERDVIFPFGTYGLRQRYAVCCVRAG